jgi:hypothetical protein
MSRCRARMEPSRRGAEADQARNFGGPENAIRHLSRPLWTLKLHRDIGRGRPRPNTLQQLLSMRAEGLAAPEILFSLQKPLAATARELVLCPRDQNIYREAFACSLLFYGSDLWPPGSRLSLCPYPQHQEPER